MLRVFFRQPHFTTKDKIPKFQKSIIFFIFTLDRVLLRTYECHEFARKDITIFDSMIFTKTHDFLIFLEQNGGFLAQNRRC